MPDLAITALTIAGGAMSFAVGPVYEYEATRSSERSTPRSTCRCRQLPAALARDRIFRTRPGAVRIERSDRRVDDDRRCRSPAPRHYPLRVQSKRGLPRPASPRILVTSV